MKLSLTIYEPGHRDGNALGWHWEVLSTGECLDCGTCRTAWEATEAADVAWSRAELERDIAQTQELSHGG